MPRRKRMKRSSSIQTTDDSDDGELFAVQNILKHRMKSDGIVEYLLLWKGYPRKEATWEVESNLCCPTLLRRYKQKKGLQADDETKPLAKNSAPNLRSRSSSTPSAPENGFDRGWSARKVLGVTRLRDKSLWVLISWNESPKPGLVPNYVANEKIPQMVIDYHQKSFFWAKK